MTDEKKSNELDVLFPAKEIKLADDSVVNVRPLSLEDIPKVTTSLGRLISFAASLSKTAPAGEDADFSHLITVGADELMSLIPYCVDRDVKLIPFSCFPEIMLIVIEQNITEESVGKWAALAKLLAGRMGINLEELAGALKAKSPLQG